MIGYFVPHRVFHAGYHCDPKQPVPFAHIASQKNHMSLYFMCFYGDKDQEAWFRAGFAKAGKKLDAGKACVRFKKLDDLALDVVGEAIRRIPAKKYIANYLAVLGGTASNKKREPAQRKATKPASKRVSVRT